jgi:hypothetical protein
MDVTTADNARDINAKAKYQDVSSISKDGETGKKTAGCQDRRVTVWGILNFAANTNDHPIKTAKTTKNPCMLNFGLTR